MTAARIGLLVVAALALGACNSVLGIEQATLDEGNGGAAGTSGGAGGGGGTSAGTPCDQYCDSIVASCTGPNQEYIDGATCRVFCQVFDPGPQGDTTSDSLACRMHYAALATKDPNLHCKHAGPLGTGTCGKSQCAAYCSLNVGICNTLNQTPAYTSEADCIAACMVFPYKSGSGDIELTTGDTLNCRMYHLEAAANPDNPTASATHCPHTQPVTSHCSDL